MKYRDQIKTPLWQKRRLEVLQRDNFTCQRCAATDKQLQVHHLVYHPDVMIWQYQDNELITLCHNCHKHESENFENSLKLLVQNIRVSGLLSDEINHLAQSEFKKNLFESL